MKVAKRLEHTSAQSNTSEAHDARREQLPQAIAIDSRLWNTGGVHGRESKVREPSASRAPKFGSRAAPL